MIAFKEALNTAEKLNAKTIAMSLISSGVYGVGLGDVIRPGHIPIYLKNVTPFLFDKNTLKAVRELLVKQPWKATVIAWVWNNYNCKMSKDNYSEQDMHTSCTYLHYLPNADQTVMCIQI